MIAVPIGPRTQRFATAAFPEYLNRPAGLNIREICSPMPICVGAFLAALPRAHGISSALTRWCASSCGGHFWYAQVDAAVAGIGIIPFSRGLAAPALGQRRSRASA